MVRSSIFAIPPLLLGLLLAGNAEAQAQSNKTAQSEIMGESKTLDRIAREQETVGQRIEHLLKKMDRLIRKNELEGKQHQADLIRGAKAEIEKRALLKRIDELDEKILDSQLTVAGEQEQLLKDLEDIFAILQDRSDLERLDDLLHAYTEGLQGIRRLADQQDELLSETRELLYDEAKLIEDAKKRVGEILESQRSVSERTQRVAGERNTESAWWDAAKRLEELARDQDELAGRTFDHLEEATEANLSEAKADQETLENRAEAMGRTLKDFVSERGENHALDAAALETLEDTKTRIDEARRWMAEAVSEFEEENPSKGWQAQKKATEELREAYARMEQAGKDAFRRSRENQLAAAAAQEDLIGRMNDVDRELERLDDLRSRDESTDSTARGAERQKAKEIVERMKSARDRLRRGEVGPARPEQDRAEAGLSELGEMLDQAESEVETSPNLTAEERKEKTRDLANRQKKLEERVRDLMRRLRELPDRQPIQDLSNAADNMAGAASELSEEMTGEAEQDQEEAKKHLEKALKEMTREEQKYQNIRQQEVLFRVQQVLAKLKEDQDEVNRQTEAFHLAREDTGRLSRRKRKELRRYVDQETEIQGRTREVTDKTREEASTVFTWVLERVVEDLDEIKDSLRRGETGPLVQSLQTDVSDRYGELIETLKDEMKRRQSAKQDEQEGQQQPPDQQKNSLIPPVAELLMIKRMEEKALKRLNTFLRIHSEDRDAGTGDMEAEMLERMGHRHSSITELFEKMVNRSGGPLSEPEMQEENR